MVVKQLFKTLKIATIIFINIWGGDFLGELKNCVEPINVQDDLDATKYELESYEASLESAQRALMDIKEIVQRISGLGRVRQSQTALDALQEIVEIVDQEV